MEAKNHSSHGSLLWLHVNANRVKVCAATPEEAHDAVAIFHRDGEGHPVSESERPVRLDVGDKCEGCYDVARAIEATCPGNALHELRGGKLNLHCYKGQRRMSFTCKKLCRAS